ncbi:MAG: hypothetical protein ACRDTT_10775 [Pseudonocardiaceae bacterium]
MLHNGGPQPRTITLDRPYRKLAGTLDPATNDGEFAQTVTIPAHDGLVLLRESS